jgi:alcohol dehydrogenase class IV
MGIHVDFSSAARVLFGSGCILEAVDVIAGFPQPILLVMGSGNEPSQHVESLLSSRGLKYQVFRVVHEPSVELVQEGVRLVHSIKAGVIVGLGGGSALDTAKAIAGMGNNPGELLDYLEVIGGGKQLAFPSLPMAAIPTTAGTGTEVTRNAVLTVTGRRVKVSLRSPYLLPRLAVVDPGLTLSLPPRITATTGMDALTQVIEPFVSIRANPMVDGFCREGITRIGRSLLTAYRHGNNLQAREDMSYASLMGGLALANSGLGAVHGFAAPLGGMYAAAHGALCARLLAPVIRVNLGALRRREPGSETLAKYHEVARLITGRSRAKEDDLVNWVENLCEAMQIPKLREFGIRQDEFDEIAQKAQAASSMKANPIRLETAELLNILAMAY